MEFEDCKVGMKCKVTSPISSFFGLQGTIYHIPCHNVVWLDIVDWNGAIIHGLRFHVREISSADETNPAEVCFDEKCPDCGARLEWVNFAYKCPECWRVL